MRTNAGKKSKHKVSPAGNDCVPDGISFTDKNTAIVEYFESIRHEYDCQADQKNSFENRSGFLLSVFGVIFVYVMDKAPIKDIIAQYTTPLTFVILLKIIAGTVIYLGFLSTFILLLLTIATRKQKLFDVSNIDNKRLEEERYKALVMLSLSYQDAVNNRIQLNDRRGKLYRLALYAFVVTFFAAALYISL